VSAPVTTSALVRTRPAPPARIVHIGLGAFSRSHIAWYTAHAADAQDWGIAAYAGRSAELPQALTAQDGLYTLVVRSKDRDSAEVIESVVRAHRGDDTDSLFDDIASSSTAIVTLTVTEAGYRATALGEPDSSDPAVAADLAALTRIAGGLDPKRAGLGTAMGRLVAGLYLRQQTSGLQGAGALAIVCCDNMPDNGPFVRGLVLALAGTIPGLAAWIEENISFVSTSIDRITPRVSAEEQQILAQTYGDQVAVVAEPFTDWVLSGEFPAGRPQWEASGARIVQDIAPWETRKLWLLNGAHSLLACMGPLRGHEDVAHAIADPACLGAVEAFWDEAERHLPEELGVPAYRQALLERFGNPRIQHLLAQIALDTETKLRVRVAPVAQRELEAGRSAYACATVFGAWIAKNSGTVATGSDEANVLDVAHELRRISSVLADDRGFVNAVQQAVNALSYLAPSA